PFRKAEIDVLRPEAPGQRYVGRRGRGTCRNDEVNGTFRNPRKPGNRIRRGYPLPDRIEPLPESGERQDTGERPLYPAGSRPFLGDRQKRRGDFPAPPQSRKYTV